MWLERIPTVPNTEGRSSLPEKIAAYAVAFCLLFILLATSVQALCFWIPDWWRSEYAKYDTPSNVNGEMSLDDAVSVTEDMLDYCIGRIDTLDDSTATIDGVTAPFFTDREKMHLADCRELFGKGLRARQIAVILLVGLLFFIFYHAGREGGIRLLCTAYLRALGITIAAIVVIGALCVIDFTRVFTIFHHIFFDNDLWILYPDKDNLINIMQEAVFFDAAKWIGSIWLASSATLAIVAVIYKQKSR